MAEHFEAKKHAYRQTQDGVVISFVCHPNDVAKMLTLAPLGTRYTSQGRMIATMQAAVDQYEREKIRDRTVDGMAELKRQGQYIGRPRLVDEAKAAKMKAMRKHATPAQIASRFGVSVATVNKYAPKRKT